VTKKKKVIKIIFYLRRKYARTFISSYVIKQRFLDITLEINIIALESEVQNM